MFRVADYLARIGYSGATAPTFETLAAVHRAHMLAVPFENLDIALGRKIVVDEDVTVRKVVQLRRGGFCYELNGAFAALLRALGFAVTLLSARVSRPGGGDGPEFDHLALRVDLSESYLADVGFGESFLEPRRLEERGEQADPAGTFRIVEVGERLQMEKLSEVPTLRKPRRVGQPQIGGAKGTGLPQVYIAEESGLPQVDVAKGWRRQYSFTLEPRRLEEFAGMCRYHQTSPVSSFTQNQICSRATEDGRITLSGMKLIVTRGGQREERAIHSDEERTNILRELFRIEL